MEAIGAISGLITVVEVSVRISRLCLAYSRDVKNASDDIKRLEQTVLHLRSTTESVLDLLQGPDNWRLQASQKLRQAAEDSKTRLDNLEERLQPSSTRGKFMRLGLSSLKWPFQKKDMDRLITELSQCSQAISAALQVDQLNVQLQTSEDVANIDRGIRDLDRRALLDQLPVVHGAAYDSHAEEQNSVCLADTRVDYLHQILEWANAPDAETLLWLKGMAGTGKSTISRTIARSLAARGLLGANFFFKRGESDRSSVNKLFTTLAFQLSVGNGRIAQQVIAALKSDPALPNKATRDQFDKLILEPILLAYQGHEKGTLVVILDALDECENQNDARNVIHLFSQSRSLPSLKLRVFITSRPEVMIRLGFNEVTGNYRILDLSDAPTITVEQDIARYFTIELARIRREYNVRVAEDRRLDEDWPGQNRARDLIEMAIPLFIFAATVCRFLAEVRWEPDEQLVKILNYRALSQLSKLDATYTPVLDQLTEGLSQPEVDEVIGDFREIVGSIILLESPMTTLALSKILEVAKRRIDRSLDLLHSVLSIPESAETPVRLLHISFRDYLIDPKLQSVNPFWIDKKDVHQRLSHCCLRAMTHFLHEDLCDLRMPGALRNSISQRRIDGSIPSEIRYAVRYWAHHISEGGGTEKLLDAAHKFLKLHVLHWIEALSILGHLSESLHAIKSLESLVPKSKQEEKGGLSEFLSDALQLIRRFFEGINVAPLQVYCSALAFSPSSSVILHHCGVPDWIIVPPRMPSAWDPCVLVLEGHERWVHTCIMSPDSSIIAAATSDSTIWLWNAETGEYKARLEGHTKKVDSIAFSVDSKQLASYSSDRTVKLWDVETSSCLTTQEFPQAKLRASIEQTVALQNSTLLARFLQEDGSFKIWRVDTGELVETIDTAGKEVGAVTRTNGSSIVVSGPDAMSLQGWRTNRPSRMHQLSNNEEPTGGGFSPDGTLFALGLGKVIRVFITRTFRKAWELSHHDRPAIKFAFSPDSTLLVSGYDDSTICVWRLDTGDCVRTISSHRTWITSLAFSADSSMIISSAADATIRVWRASFQDDKKTTGSSMTLRPRAITPDLKLAICNVEEYFRPWTVKYLQIWDTEMGRHIRDIAVESEGITASTISQDSSVIAVAYDTGRVRVWSLSDGECLHQITHDSEAEIFSLTLADDLQTLACSSTNKSIHVYEISTNACIQTLIAPEQVSYLTLEGKTVVRAEGFSSSMPYIFNSETGQMEVCSSISERPPKGFGLDKSRRWITWQGEILLYLPPQYFWSTKNLAQRIGVDECTIAFVTEEKDLAIAKLDRSYLASISSLDRNSIYSH